MFDDPQPSISAGVPVVSVSDLLLRARRSLESSIPLGWVAGEVSNLTRAGSGHLYFTIKDDKAQVRCTMWRTRAQLLPFQLQEGMHVEVRALITIYEPRGDLQLTVESIRRAGAGAAFENFLRLKQKLEQEGLFDATRKRPLPRLPHTIGIVTSLAAAALHDVVTTLQRRAPNIAIIIYPSVVQGDGAGEKIADAVRQASARAEQDRLDAIVVCRGGGSTEDLWSFNNEALARAVAACPVPVVSGVGHETDVTLCDLVADLRAATPTAAAELISTAWVESAGQLQMLRSRLTHHTLHRVNTLAQRMDDLQRRLIHPSARLKDSRDRLAQMQMKMKMALSNQLNGSALKLARVRNRIQRTRPRFDVASMQVEGLGMQLQRAMHAKVMESHRIIDNLKQQLDHLNPTSILKRGYAIVRMSDGSVVRDAGSLYPHQTLAVQFASGAADVEVKQVKGDPEGK